MSKLENIRKHVAEGKGNQKMLEYLLFCIKGLEDQLAQGREIFKGERYKEGSAPHESGRHEVQFVAIRPWEDNSRRI